MFESLMNPYTPLSKSVELGSVGFTVSNWTIFASITHTHAGCRLRVEGSAFRRLFLILGAEYPSPKKVNLLNHGKIIGTPKG